MSMCPLLQQQLLVLHDQERATDPPRVGEDADLSLPDVPHHGNLKFEEILEELAAGGASRRGI